MIKDIFDANLEGREDLLHLAQEALLSPCSVSRNKAFLLLRRSYHPDDKVQLWTIRHCPKGNLSAGFIHYVSPDECRHYDVPLGQVKKEYSHRVNRERVIQIGII